MQNTDKDELLISQLFDAQQDFVLWMKPSVCGDPNKKNIISDFEICYYNKAAATLFGTTQQAAVGKFLVKDNFLGQVAGHLAFDQSVQVFLNGGTQEFTYFNPLLQKYFNVSRTRVNEGVLNIARNITAYVAAERKMQEQSEFLNGILEASANGILVCDAIRDINGKITDFDIIKKNQAFENMIGKTAAEVEGKTFLNLFPHDKTFELFDLNCKVTETGKPLKKEIYYKGENLNLWLDISIIKSNENSILITFNDITQVKQSLLHIEKQKILLDNILKHSPSGVAVIKVIRDENGEASDGFVIVANDAATQITGISRENITSKISSFDPEISANPLFHIALSAAETGKPFLTQYFLKSSRKWLELGISKIDEENIVAVFTDITSSKIAQLKVERSASQLLGFINTAQSGFSHMKPVKNKNGEVIDFRFDITNAAFTAYANVTPETVNGETVSKFYPSYKENGLFERYKYTYDTSETVRFESHYSGDGIDAWFDILCTKMEDGVLVTIADLTALKKLQIDLETLVNELKKSNANLQEFAYVASHDLQEPLRKIQVFAERLKKDVGDELSEENKKVFERMIGATQRMSQLINDLLSYSQITTKKSAFKTVNLNELLQQVLTNLEATITEKNGTVTAANLPCVKGDPSQLRQLFQNLISNSLKYSKQNVSPVISVSSEIVGKEVNGMINSFNKIEIKDNGIGFEQQYAERIFKLFQRLHGRSEYPGTGIGLAIVQKVVENHNGYIEAEAEPEKGATFKVYLPV